MSTATALERFFGKRQQSHEHIEAERLGSYQQLVEQLAGDGKPPAAAEVDQLLAAADKTDADLRADVEARQSELADLELVSQLDAVVGQLRELGEQEQQLETDFRATYRELIETRQADVLVIHESATRLRAKHDRILAAQGRLANRD